MTVAIKKEHQPDHRLASAAVGLIEQSCCSVVQMLLEKKLVKVSPDIVRRFQEHLSTDVDFMSKFSAFLDQFIKP